MSQQAVERALGKLVTDEAFRAQFYRDPAATSFQAGLDLSGGELDALRRIPREALVGLWTVLDDRICRLGVADEPAEEPMEGASAS